MEACLHRTQLRILKSYSGRQSGQKECVETPAAQGPLRATSSPPSGTLGCQSSPPHQCSRERVTRARRKKRKRRLCNYTAKVSQSQAGLVRQRSADPWGAARGCRHAARPSAREAPPLRRDYDNRIAGFCARACWTSADHTLC